MGRKHVKLLNGNGIRVIFGRKHIREHEVDISPKENIGSSMAKKACTMAMTQKTMSSRQCRFQPRGRGGDSGWQEYHPRSKLRKAFDWTGQRDGRSHAWPQTNQSPWLYAANRGIKPCAWIGQGLASSANKARLATKTSGMI